jgi:hypothetical protein
MGLDSQDWLSRLTVGRKVTLILTSIYESLEKLASSEADVRWPPAYEGESPEAEEHSLLKDVTKQCSERPWLSLRDSDL